MKSCHHFGFCKWCFNLELKQWLALNWTIRSAESRYLDRYIYPILFLNADLDLELSFNDFQQKQKQCSVTMKLGPVTSTCDSNFCNRYRRMFVIYLLWFTFHSPQWWTLRNNSKSRNKKTPSFMKGKEFKVLQILLHSVLSFLFFCFRQKRAESFIWFSQIFSQSPSLKTRDYHLQLSSFS